MNYKYIVGIFFILVSSSGWQTTDNLVSKKQIPILSYHNILTTNIKDGPYHISQDHLEAHIKYLKEHGYVSVLPEDIYNYYLHDTTLPDKCIMFSFDDTRKEHFTMAAPLLEKYGYKGTFFIMTVAIGKKNYMTSEEIKNLSDRGHCIGHHTYDHQNLKKLPVDQWKKQISDPKTKLENIIGINVCYLAYPFGLCNDFAANELAKNGIYAGFQLSGKQRPENELYFIRRLLVPGTWSNERLLKEINFTF